MASSVEAPTMFKQVVSQLSPISSAGLIRWPQTIFLYVISHGFMLASWNALYWDDWMVYVANSSGEPLGAFASGSECVRWCIPLRSWTESLLTSPGPWLMRAVTFVYFPITAWLLSRFLLRTNWLRQNEITLVTLFWLLLPANGARAGLVMSYYSFSVLLFALGSWMLFSRRPITRVLSLFPLFWSMFTASLQVFAFALLVMLLAKRSSEPREKQRLTTLLALVLIVLLFAHRFILPFVSSSFEITRDGYNEIQPAFLMRGVLISVLLMSPLLYFLNRRRLQMQVALESYQLGIGLAVLAAGTFPYLAVGHFANLSDWILPFLPDESDWNSRHQLLQPFGLAVILAAVSQMLGARMRSFAAVVLTFSVAINIATYSGYYLDAMKQREFINAIEDADTQLEGVSALVINDQAPRFNARGRELRSYEWTAMLSKATARNILVDSNSIQFCHESRPTKMLTITAARGRLESLFTGSIGISVDFDRLPACDFPNEVTP